MVFSAIISPSISTLHTITFFGFSFTSTAFPLGLVLLPALYATTGTTSSFLYSSSFFYTSSLIGAKSVFITIFGISSRIFLAISLLNDPRPIIC
jgi:hypothetical protein